MLKVTIIERPLPRVLKYPLINPINMDTARTEINAKKTPPFKATFAHIAALKPSMEPTERSTLPAIKVAKTPSDTIPRIYVCFRIFVRFSTEKNASLEIDKTIKRIKNITSIP